MRELTIVIKRKGSAFGPADGIVLVSIGKFKARQRLRRDQENKRIRKVNSSVSALKTYGIGF